MAQPTKLLASKADNLILISRSHKIKIGNQHLQVIL